MNVQLKSVTKVFPGVRALDSVSLDIRSGEVLGLVGENGAGKSTLMKILSGVYPHGTYEGSVMIDQNEVRIDSPSKAEELGIAIIHQELSAFPHLSVAENLFVGHWPTASGRVDWSKMHESAQYWIDLVGAPCRVQDKMSSLSVGTQQLVEIAKALSRNSQVLILDEPTSSLTPNETKKLFALLKDLRAKGKALVYISHKMEEIFELCNRIAVLRDGQSVHQCLIQETSPEKLVEHMVGRTIQNIYPKSPTREFGRSILELKSYSARLPGKSFQLGPLSFAIREGEIFGIGGLLGAGRSELVKAVFGDEGAQRLDGDVYFEQQPVDFHTPEAALRKGLSFVSEDRKGESILPQRSLVENASISKLAVFFNRIRIDDHAEKTQAQKRLSELNTKCSSVEQQIHQLSGGNQQKVIIARAMETNARLIILDEPTRGIDVKAKSEIYEIIFHLAKSGKAVLLISSDLPELMALSDRIAMMREGKIRGILERGNYSQVELMRLAFGT